MKNSIFLLLALSCLSSIQLGAMRPNNKTNDISTTEHPTAIAFEKMWRKDENFAPFVWQHDHIRRKVRSCSPITIGEQAELLQEWARREDS